MKRFHQKYGASAPARRHLEGLTLVELMIVVVILALIGTAVTVAVLPQLEKANIKTTATDAQAIRSAVTLWIAEHPGKCPSVKELVDDKTLDNSKRHKDAWDHDFDIKCEGTEIMVVSPGPDGQMGTEDDIH